MNCKTYSMKAFDTLSHLLLLPARAVHGGHGLKIGHQYHGVGAWKEATLDLILHVEDRATSSELGIPVSLYAYI